MAKSRKAPKYEQTLSAALIAAKDAVIAPMRPKLREFNITEPQCRVMRMIRDRRTAEAVELVEIGGMYPPSVTRIIKELESRKLLYREAHPSDRRRILVALTPEGEELHNIISLDVRRVAAELSARFGADRLERLINELRALTSSMHDIK